MEEWVLKQRQSLPLSCKIIKSIRTMEQYYRKYDGEVYISTGGADSSVVQWLAQQSLEIKNIPCVCVASVEPTGNIKLNHDRGDILLKSTIAKKQVITDWGYPLISKVVAMSLSRYARTKHDWVKERRLHGYLGRNGRMIMEGSIPKKYQDLIFAPFELSEKCCDKTKKKPLRHWEATTKSESIKKWDYVTIKKPITGEIAEESRERKKNYLKHGCIMFDKQHIKCTPIGFWTDQDVKQCIYENNIPISREYGEVIKNEDGTYSFTGEKRTGCDICGFGIMEDVDRFERLKINKPAIYKNMMQGGKWIRKDLYRWVKFRHNSMPIWSNLYWVPDDRGYGYRLVLNYFYKVMKIDKYID